MANTKLDNYLDSYTPFNDWLIQKRYEKLKNYFKGTTCLEMGVAEGTGIEHLLDFFKSVTVVDGSREAISAVKKKFPSSRLREVHSFFEEMDFGNKKFDTIIMAHILEHVDDPKVVLEHAKRYLKPGGVLIVDVPNGNSLHRQVGVRMGMLKERTELNEADLSIGHQRVYVPETFKNEIARAGLKITHFGGMFIKVLSNAQTEKAFNEEQLKALFAIGEENPDIAAEIYAIAQIA